jgi:drug/metabolite transporter (DMT)-like permease
MVSAASAAWLLALLQGQVGKTLRALRDRRASRFIAGGAFTGPFVGVWLSMIAVQRAQVGLASTLMALSPVHLIPLSYWFFQERVSARAVGGAVVALVGLAIIFLI